MRRILTEARQQELVADYLAGVKRVDLSKKYDLFPPQIYAYLRKNGVQANRAGGQHPKYHCVVCGEDRPLPPYSPNKIWRSTAACSDLACKTLLTVRPDLRKRPSFVTFKGKKSAKPPSSFRWEDLRELKPQQEILFLDDIELAALQKAFQLSFDERGVDVPEKAQTALWGRMSKLSIAVHLRAPIAGETSVTLADDEPFKEFTRRFLGRSNEEMLSMLCAFDVIYLWRCSCPQQQVYIIRTREEFPKRPGEYGVCPLCSAAALEIVNEPA